MSVQISNVDGGSEYLFAEALSEIIALTHDEKGRLARQINKIAFSALAQDAALRRAAAHSRDAA